MNYPQRFYRLTKPLGERMSHNKVLAIVAASALVVACLAMAVVHRRQRIVHLGYELSQLVKQRDALAEDIRGLQVERAVLAAPDRVRRLATELGMQPPLSNNVTTVPYDGPPMEPAAPPSAVVTPDAPLPEAEVL